MTQVWSHLAVEGALDEIILRRIFNRLRIGVFNVIRRDGRSFLESKIASFNRSAQNANWVVLADLDCDDCAPKLAREWLPKPNQGMILRIAVREVEAWLIADCAALAKFLEVDESRFPTNPESLADPKKFLVALAAMSLNRDLRMGMVPSARSRRIEGPEYTSILGHFVNQGKGGWNMDRAAKRSNRNQASCHFHP